MLGERKILALQYRTAPWPTSPCRTGPRRTKLRFARPRLAPSSEENPCLALQHRTPPCRTTAYRTRPYPSSPGKLLVFRRKPLPCNTRLSLAQQRCTSPGQTSPCHAMLFTSFRENPCLALLRQARPWPTTPCQTRPRRVYSINSARNLPNHPLFCTRKSSQPMLRPARFRSSSTTLGSMTSVSMDRDSTVCQ